VADFLDAKVKEIEARLRELQPLIEEYHRLEAAASALVNVDGRVAAVPARSANGARRGRPRGSRGGNTRATQAVELVRGNPGITIPDLAGHMGIKPNYLYRILPQLEEEGKVRRKDKGWHPA
jgi:Winged helix-turn-helix DNA-binding